MAVLNDIEVPSNLSGTFEELQLQSEGWWFIKPRSPNFVVTGKLAEGATSNISQDGSGLRVFVKQADVPLSVFLQADCEENHTIIVDYSDSFFDVGALGGSGSGGGGGTTYTFNAPLNDNGGSISLNLAGDLQVRSGNLTLKLTSNADFMQLAQLVQGLTSGIEWVGKTNDTNAQVEANHQLLSDYVQAKQGRAPRIGDLVLTSDTPPFGWIYTNTYDPASGQITGQDWETIGTTAVSIATQNTIGLIKGSSTLQIDVDGTANVQGVVFDSGNQQISGVKTFNGQVNISNGNLVLANASDYNLKTSANWGFRFQLDNMSGNKDLIRIHKAGSKWNLRYIESGGAFAWCELNGLTWIPNLKGATDDSNATNLGDVKAKINEVLDGTNPFKTRIKAGATGSECRFTPDDRAKTLYFSDSQSGNIQWTIDGENKIVFQNMPTPTESHHFATKGYVDDSLSSYKKIDIIPSGGSLPAQTEADTMYFIEV